MSNPDRHHDPAPAPVPAIPLTPEGGVDHAQADM